MELKKAERAAKLLGEYKNTKNSLDQIVMGKKESEAKTISITCRNVMGVKTKEFVAINKDTNTVLQIIEEYLTTKLENTLKEIEEL